MVGAEMIAALRTDPSPSLHHIPHPAPHSVPTSVEGEIVGPPAARSAGGGGGDLPKVLTNRLNKVVWVHPINFLQHFLALQAIRINFSHTSDQVFRVKVAKVKQVGAHGFAHLDLMRCFTKWCTLFISWVLVFYSNIYACVGVLEQRQV